MKLTHLIIHKLRLVECEHERDSGGFSFDKKAREGEGFRLGVFEREKHEKLVDVSNGRVENLGGSLEDILDHAPAVNPIDGPHKNLVPDHHPPLNLLQQRPHHAENLHPAEASRRFVIFGDDDAHEVGLRRRHHADGLGFRQRRAVFEGEDRGKTGILFQCLFRLQEVAARGSSLFVRVLLLLLVSGGDRWETAEAAEEESGRVCRHRAVAEHRE